MMKGIMHHKYGPPHGLELPDVDTPALTDDGVLVRVRASSLNAGDWYALTGTPYAGRLMMGGLRKPKGTAMGADFAGTVEAVGSAVVDFKPGEEVFGARRGAW